MNQGCRKSKASSIVPTTTFVPSPSSSRPVSTPTRAHSSVTSPITTKLVVAVLSSSLDSVIVWPESRVTETEYTPPRCMTHAPQKWNQNVVPPFPQPQLIAGASCSQPLTTPQAAFI